MIDITGKTFNRWSVIKISRAEKYKSYWECVCECGTVRNVEYDRLINYRTKSCGCYRIEAVKKAVTTHGVSRGKNEFTSEYRTWNSMKARCYSKNDSKYYMYGAVGIRVCDRWRHSFQTFLSDMGPKPTHGHTIDRFPNQSGNYEPGNCRWATHQQQQENLKSNIWIEYKGERMIAARWGERLDIAAKKIVHYLRNGKDMDYIVKHFDAVKARKTGVAKRINLSLIDRSTFVGECIINGYKENPALTRKTIISQYRDNPAVMTMVLGEENVRRIIPWTRRKQSQNILQAKSHYLIT